jgi:hypothetical protein
MLNANDPKNMWQATKNKINCYPQIQIVAKADV